MVLIIITALFLSASIYLVLYQFRAQLFGAQETHLPAQMFVEDEPITALARTKTWLPLTARFKDWERRIPFPTAGLKRKLIRAGSPVGVLEFIAFKVLSLVFIPVVSLTLLSSNFPANIVLAGSLIIGFIIPEFWLNGKIKKRQHSIRKDLPNIIDLLNLCVSAGMDFMLAVNRVVRDLKPCELTHELAEVYRETQMGETRRAALKNFGWRVDMPEVHSFVRTLVQADRMGTPMSEALNLQAEEIRVKRFQTGESMALKAPIKLLFPLFAFILPVVMIIVGGPIILQFVRGGIQFGF
jgi:tight adherence protein C